MPKQKKTSSQKVWVEADNQNKPILGPQGYFEVSEHAQVNKVQISKQTLQDAKNGTEFVWVVANNQGNPLLGLHGYTKANEQDHVNKVRLKRQKFNETKAQCKLAWVMADTQNRAVLGPQGYTEVTEQDQVNKVQITKQELWAHRYKTKLVWVVANDEGNPVLDQNGYTKVREQDPVNKVQITQDTFNLKKHSSKYIWVQLDSKGKKMKDPQGYIEVSEHDPVNKVRIAKQAFNNAKSRAISRLKYLSVVNSIPLQSSAYNELSLQTSQSLSHALAALLYYSATNDPAVFQFNPYAEISSQVAPYQADPILFIDDDFEENAPLANQLIDNSVTSTHPVNVNEENNLSPWDTVYELLEEPSNINPSQQEASPHEIPPHRSGIDEARDLTATQTNAWFNLFATQNTEQADSQPSANSKNMITHPDSPSV